MIRWIGAICVIGACGFCGFSMAASYTGIQKALRQLQAALEMMQCQMEYQLTELPELCSILEKACSGPVGRLFGAFGRELRMPDAGDASTCLCLALARTRDLPARCREILLQLGQTLGQYDLSGQLRGIAVAKDSCARELATMEAEKGGRLRSYRALGLCGGAALAILLL